MKKLMIQESLTTENFGTKPRLIEAEDDQVRGARLQRATTKRISKDRWETGLLWREDNAALPFNRPTPSGDCCNWNARWMRIQI